jgi:hypothetical protein
MAYLLLYYYCPEQYKLTTKHDSTLNNFTATLYQKGNVHLQLFRESIRRGLG